MSMVFPFGARVRPANERGRIRFQAAAHDPAGMRVVAQRHQKAGPVFKYLHHVHYAVENLDAMIDYLDKNFGMKPERVEISKGNHPAKEAVYHAGMTEIQVTEPLDTTSSLAKHLAKHGPGVYHVAWGVKEIEKLFDTAVKNGNDMRRKAVSVAPRGYKTMNIEPSTSHGIGFQLIEDPEHDV
jgi:4-hydroxyphenylpyruvate dioxygenase-like putative hemolysin